MLSKKRDSVLKVNSNGFALFVIGLTFAGFLGGAMRLFLNSERAQQRILFEVQKKFPEWNVEAETVELHLASGVWPGVTVELPHAHAYRNGSCGKPSFDVDIQSLKIPVSLWSIISGQNRIGGVSIAKINIELQTSPCPNEVKSPTETPSASGPLDRKFEVGNFGLRSVYEEIRSRAEGLILDEVLVRNPTAPDWSFIARDLHLDVATTVEMNGAFSIWKRFPSGELRQDFKLHSTLHGALLEWELKSSIKEGDFKWSGQMDEESKTFAQRVQLKQGPVKDILEMLHKAGILPNPSEAKRVWLNCQLIQGGNFQAFSSIREIPIQIETCSMDGELGRMNLEPQIFYMEKPFLRNGPLVLAIHRLSLGSLMEVLGRSKLPVIFSNLGVWTGKIEALNLAQLDFKGELEGLKLNVSNKSLRGVETLSSIRTEGKVSDQLLKVDLSDFQILGGSRGGSALLKYDMKSRMGEFNVRFNDLKPSEPIQSVLIQGRVAPIQLFIDAKIDKGQVSRLEGKFSSQGAKGQGWELFPIKGNINQIMEEQFKVKFLSENFKWDENFRYHTFASSVLNAFHVRIQEKALKDVEVNLELHSQMGKVTKAIARLQEKKVEFSGQWQRGNSLTGKIKVGKGGRWQPVELNYLSGRILN